MKKKIEYTNREISWLSFNERVLQEAEDSDNPLFERLKFLGIFSNNRDEFFKVRVASVKKMVEFNESSINFLGGTPKDILLKIQDTVLKQQIRFEKSFSKIKNELKKENIYFLEENNLNNWQGEFIKDYYQKNIKHFLTPIIINSIKNFPSIKEKHSYLAICIKDKSSNNQFAIIEIPRSEISRFVVLPKYGKKQYLMLVDDVIRYCLSDLFSLAEFINFEAYAIKLTLDADFNIDDDFSKSFIEKMTRGLKKRAKGQPVRFVYDQSINKDLLDHLKKSLKLNKFDAIIPGGRYHNFKDFINFPNLDRHDLEYDSFQPLNHPSLVRYQSIFDEINKKDILLHFPYQTFDHIIDLLREAAIDPKVKSIKMTLYRLANKSKIIRALINAAKNGKKVKVILELQARFDEENNIRWSDKLREGGVEVDFGIEGLKIHSKICLISRKEDNTLKNYAAIGTGNFNEKTAQIYGDNIIITANTKLTNEVAKIFKLLDNSFQNYRFRKLIVSPYSTRIKLKQLIVNEIKNAKAGKNSWIFLKMNSLSDRDLINKLYEASNAGVNIKLIVRGICCLVPGLEGLSENIKVISIVDRFLEHSRIYSFANHNNPIYLISSADFMSRNLDRRIEVTCPIEDKSIQSELKEILEIQWRDQYKARIINNEQSNAYMYNKSRKNRAQVEIYKYLRKKD